MPQMYPKSTKERQAEITALKPTVTLGEHSSADLGFCQGRPNLSELQFPK